MIVDRMLLRRRMAPLFALLGLSLAACGSDSTAGGATDGDDDADGAGEPDGEPAPGDGQDADVGGDGAGDGSAADGEGVVGNPGDGDDADGPLEGHLLPWKEGNTWTYRVIGNGVESEKVITVGAEEEVGGTGPNAEKLAFKVVTAKGADRTVSWQANVGDLVVRYREQSFFATTGELKQEEHWDPYKLHVDSSAEHRAAGASWLEEYDETKAIVGAEPVSATKRDQWIVDSPNEEVTVPAGTFRAVVLQKAGGTSVKTYWYVPGVGKVKETGGQTEELVRYEVSP